MSNQSNDIAVKSAGESFGSNNSTDLTEKHLAVRNIRDEEAQAPKEKNSLRVMLVMVVEERISIYTGLNWHYVLWQSSCVFFLWHWIKLLLPPCLQLLGINLMGLTRLDGYQQGFFCRWLSLLPHGVKFQLYSEER